MKKLVLILALVFCFSAASRAQGLLDKIEGALNKVENTSNKVDRNAEKANRIGGKLGGLMGKKGAKATTFTVLIEGMKLAELKSLASDLESNKKVAEVKTKYNASGSALTIQFSGDSEDLLNLLKKNSPKITDDTVQAIEDDGISIKVEK